MNRSQGRVEGKVAIITGAAKGLGRADAELLAQEGAKVVLTDVDTAEGEKVAAGIGPNALFVPQDVTDEAGWQRLIEQTVGHFGGLHVLVNNAGIVTLGDPETATAEDYRRIMAVSMDATFYGCKYAIPAMRDSGGGSIINMSSIAALVGESYVAAYCAAKGAIRSYTKAVAVHCAQNAMNIRCNSIHPAGIDTPMVRSVQAQTAGAARPEPGAAPVRASRLGEAKDIAYAVLYLASDESRFVNGAEMVIDNSITVMSGIVP